VPTLDDLPALKAKVYRDKKGQDCRIRIVALDTGYDTINCYRACMKYPGWLRAIKGEKGKLTRQTKPIMPSSLSSMPGGKQFQGGAKLTLYHVHPNYFKDQLSSALSETDEVKIFFHNGIDKDYVYEMCGEVLKESKPDRFGETTLSWFRIHRNNYFDLAQYAFAVRYIIHNELLKLKKKATRVSVISKGAGIDDVEPSDGEHGESGDSQQQAEPQSNTQLRCPHCKVRFLEATEDGRYLKCKCGYVKNLKQFSSDRWAEDEEEGE
jgi:phage terminase large subunit GpA-like protein